MRFLLLFTFLLGSFVLATAQDEPDKPEENYTDVHEQPLFSTLTIPVQVTKVELERSVNKYVSGILYKDVSFDDNGGDDLMVIASKSKPITLNLYGNTVKYRVPLRIWLSKKLMLGTAEADGELALNFKTDYQLQEDWSVKTVTVVEYHEWIQKPALKTGYFDIPIQWIGDLVLEKTKTELSKIIDSQIADQLSFKDQAETAWRSIQEPVLLSEEYDMWIKTTPESIGITPFRVAFGMIEANIGVHCANDVTFGEKPSFRENRKLPNLHVIPNLPEGFQVRIATDIPYKEAEKMAKTNLIGQVFESGSRSVQIEDIELYGQDEQMVVKAALTGAYTGSIFFTGTPTLDAERNEISMHDLDFEVKTHNFLHRTAAWLFQGPIRRKMEESMVFPLTENLDTLKFQVQETLKGYVIQPGVLLSGSIQDMRVEDTFLTKNGIRVNMLATGKLKVNVEGL